MKRKNEENLIRLAFGDMDPGDAERAKKLLVEDAEASKLFAGYSEIREGLKQLHVPEHQLSTERLREAILRDGLKKEAPVSSGWRWSLAPLAVAGAAMFLTIRFAGQTTAGPVVAPDSGPVAIDLGPSIERRGSSTSDDRFALDAVAKDIAGGSVRSAARSAAATIEEPKEIAAPPAPATVATRSNEISIAKKDKADAAVGTKLAAAEIQPAALSPEDISGFAIDGALPAGAVALHADATGEQPIILIGAENDEFTGANRATEVSSASNVIVGG